MVMHTLAAFAGVSRLLGTLVAVAPGDHFLDAYAHPAFFTVECGGPTRADTVLGGLRALEERGAQPDDWVLVHDAARCCLPAEALARLIDELDADPCGGLLALPVADTLKRQDKDSRVAATVPRDGLWQAQTPQMFRHGLLSQALAISSSADITDEASAIERLGLCPRLVRGDASNFKVTYAQDIRLAAALLSAGQN